MNFPKQLAKRVGLIGTAVGSLVLGLSVLPNTASANQMYQQSQQYNRQYNRQQPGRMPMMTVPNTRSVLPLSQIRVADLPTYPLNPCPGIYYEWPYNQRVVVPRVCRANAITQRLDQLGLLQQVRQSTPQTGTPGGRVAPYYPN